MKTEMKETIVKVFVVLGSHVAHIISMGISLSFGILYSEIKAGFKSSHAEASWIASIFVGFLGFTGLILGYLIHKVKERWLTTVGTLLLCTGMVTSSFATTTSTLYITYGVVAGIGAGIIHYCANTILVRHFTARWYPLVITLSNSGSSVSALILSPVLTTCISAYGWQKTFLILAGISSVGLFSAACFSPKQMETRDPSKGGQITKESDDNPTEGDTLSIRTKVKEVLKNRRFMVFYVSTITAFTVVFVPTTYLPDLMKYEGRDSQEISSCVMILGIGNLVGRLLSGVIGSKFDKQLSLVFGLSISGFGVSILLMIIAQSFTTFMVLSAILGLFSGAYLGLLVAVIAYYLTKSHMPVGFGMQTATNGVFSIPGVPLAGLMSDRYPGEVGSFVFGGAIMCLSALIFSTNLIIDKCEKTVSYNFDSEDICEKKVVNINTKDNCERKVSYINNTKYICERNVSRNIDTKAGEIDNETAMIHL